MKLTAYEITHGCTVFCLAESPYIVQCIIKYLFPDEPKYYDILAYTCLDSSDLAQWMIPTYGVRGYIMGEMKHWQDAKQLPFHRFQTRQEKINQLL